MRKTLTRRMVALRIMELIAEEEILDDSLSAAYTSDKIDYRL